MSRLCACAKARIARCDSAVGAGGTGGMQAEKMSRPQVMRVSADEGVSADGR